MGGEGDGGRNLAHIQLHKPGLRLQPQEKGEHSRWNTFLSFIWPEKVWYRITQPFSPLITLSSNSTALYIFTIITFVKMNQLTPPASQFPKDTDKYFFSIICRPQQVPVKFFQNVSESNCSVFHQWGYWAPPGYCSAVIKLPCTNATIWGAIWWRSAP